MILIGVIPKRALMMVVLIKRLKGLVVMPVMTVALIRALMTIIVMMAQIRVVMIGVVLIKVVLDKVVERPRDGALIEGRLLVVVG